MTPEEARVVLQDLEGRRLVERFDAEGEPSRWALPGAKKPTRRVRKEQALSAAALEMLELVKAEPWHVANHYFRIAAARGTRESPFGSYSVLHTLARRGLVQAVSRGGIKAWGPAGVPPPRGHMALAADARSPRRRGGPERVLSLLQEVPWQSVGELMKHLRLTQKGTDNLMRELLRRDLVVRRVVPGGMRRVNAYGLPDSPEPSPEALERVLKATLANLPEHYGKNRQVVLRALTVHPWTSAEGIVEHARGELSLAQVYQVLKNVMTEGTVQRVADGTYRYALAGAPLPARFSGVLRTGRTPGRQTNRETCLDLLEAAPPEGLSIDEVATRMGKSYDMAFQVLRKLHAEGCVRGERPRGPAAATRKVRYHFVKRPTGEGQDLVRVMEDAASALRARGYDVHLTITPPPHPALGWGGQGAAEA